MALLELDQINSYYGKSHILFDVSIDVDDGDIVTIIGRNGVGKTTTLKSIIGSVDVKSGEIHFNGDEITNREPHEVSKAGIALVPEQRRIVDGLSVQENLRLGGLGHETERSEAELLEFVFEFFPRLEKRMNQNALTMSGGEQQMLAIGRALMSEPEILLIDEPTEGLMPKHVTTIKNILTRLNGRGVTILLVEQNTNMALEISDYAYVLEEGRVKQEGSASELRNRPEVIKEFLSI